MSNTGIGIESIADKIEQKLNEEDEENEETFDDWFKSYINLVESMNNDGVVTDNNNNNSNDNVNSNNNNVVDYNNDNSNSNDIINDNNDNVNVNDSNDNNNDNVNVNDSNDNNNDNVNVNDSNDNNNDDVNVNDSNDNNNDDVNVNDNNDDVNVNDNNDNDNDDVNVNDNNDNDNDNSNDIVNVNDSNINNDIVNDNVNSNNDVIEILNKISNNTKVSSVINVNNAHDSESTSFKSSSSGTIEVTKENIREPTEKEIIENITKSKNKLINDINAQVESIEQAGDYKKIKTDKYLPDSDLYGVYYQYVIGKLFVPLNCGLKLDTNEYINNTTVFKYNAFDTPNMSMQHTIPEKVIYLKKLNQIFNHEFINNKSGDFHFNDLDKQIVKFLYKYKDYGTTKIEYGIIKSLMGKLIISLNTSCELALRDNTKSTLNTEFKQAVIRDIECMKYIQSTDGKLYSSWKTYLNSLFSLDSDKLIYVHNNYKSLNNKLKIAYDSDFLTENLLANMLKCYLPSIAINYFYVIKSIYLIARLLSIYIQEKKYMKDNEFKEFDDIVNDIYTIGTIGTILYENKVFILKQIPRSLPRYDKQISEQTQMYILNHLLTGGQYYILKMLEESLPVVASLLNQ